MNSICRAILKSIIQSKWLNIEYKNKDSEITKYWISIRSINRSNKSLIVEAFNITRSNQPIELMIYFESILSAEVIEGTYAEKNTELLEDIHLFPEKYSFIFSDKTNLHILDYLIECDQLDTTPYRSNHVLVKLIDEDTLLENAEYLLSEAQFYTIVFAFQNQLEKQKQYFLQTCLGMNVLSIETLKGTYLLAYKKLFLDVKQRKLIADKETIINREFSIDGSVQSIRKFLPEEDELLLDTFDVNRDAIIQSISNYIPNPTDISTGPYLLEVQFMHSVDLTNEFQGIIDMYDEDRVTTPIKAFFGELKTTSRRTKNYPITLMNKEINLDQLLTIHKAMKYPITYVQGPPGTGKTRTIINTIITAFFNEKTVLVSSYNNHPMNGVYAQLRGLKYGDLPIPFPAIRLGNADKVLESLRDIKMLFESTKKITVFPDFLIRNREKKENKVKALSTLLETYEEKLDLLERQETIKDLMKNNEDLNFSINIETGQLKEIEDRITQIGYITNESAINLLEDDYVAFMKFLYYTSVTFIQKLNEPKYKELFDIIAMEDLPEKVTKFNRYLSDEDNLKNFIRIFPIVITTNISAHHLGAPTPNFDLSILDEASQCSNAISLIPIIRGRNLLLVGDPQQLNPVILLDPLYNQKLMEKYKIPKEYNYIENSIYKTYIAADPISDEILLRYHYRCHEKIIGFNNKKYYNDQLIIKSKSVSDHPLVFMNTIGKNEEGKNTSLPEALEIVEYIKNHKNERIGIITPFVRQKELINEMLMEEHLSPANCGTVHAFQGDEKDVILFSSAITDTTHQKTYDWLKNNKELINVATSRAKDKLVMFASEKDIQRLNINGESNDFFELYEYIKKNGESQVTSKASASRALGLKPFSSDLEAAFMENLAHALQITNEKCILRKEVPISSIFKRTQDINDLFYSGKLDFVVFRKGFAGKERALFAIELDGPEHRTKEEVMKRDLKKKELCKLFGLKLIRVENIYARRYNNIKQILVDYFSEKSDAIFDTSIFTNSITK
jgi:hypothetical protein